MNRLYISIDLFDQGILAGTLVDITDDNSVAVLFEKLVYVALKSEITLINGMRQVDPLDVRAGLMRIPHLQSCPAQAEEQH